MGHASLIGGAIAYTTTRRTTYSISSPILILSISLLLLVMVRTMILLLMRSKSTLLVEEVGRG